MEFTPIRYLPMFLISFIFCFSIFISCENINTEEIFSENCKTLKVTASAYNSREGRIAITSWGDTLRPGMNSIAVSRDLLELGLEYCTEVKIEGLPGTFVVLDKMHPRWEKKIDIYMGTDRKKALEWGRKDIEICYLPSSSE